MTQPEYPYKDASLPAEARAKDLLSRLSIQEKAGLMFQAYISPVALDHQNPHLPLPTIQQQIDKEMNHFAILGSPPTVEEFATWYNNMQTVIMKKRWGIPVTLSSDPRHAFADNPGLSNAVTGLSEWPEQIGMVAIASEKRMKEYADIVRQEYLAIGLRAGLHPQVDLCTEPRWSRIPGSMGEDADLASRLAVAYVAGLHTEEYGVNSIQTCAKHFPGGGPQQDGYDPHFPWGAEQVYPGDQWEYHLKPFRAVFEAGVRGVMPTYGKPVGTKYESVSMAFQKEIITDLLRDECNFKGVVLTDFGLMEDRGPKMLAIVGDIGYPKCWGLEHLTLKERMLRLLEAGNDQFGGDSCVSTLVELVDEGKVPESRLDQSVEPILVEKFLLGLFENPFVDVEQAKVICKNAKFVEAGRAAQRDCIVPLVNKDAILPLSKGIKVYQEGFKSFPEGFASTVVDNPEAAEVIILRLQAPFVPKGTGIFASAFHHGPLDFPQAILDNVKALSRHGKPVVVEIFADRPPILSSLLDDASAILFSFGVQAIPLLEVLFGDSNPVGTLPFDVPSSSEAVLASKSDTAFDSENPSFRFGFGLKW